MSKDDYPTMRHWTNGGALTGFLGDQMEVEVRSALAENERLRDERTAERALADRLAVALQEMFDPSLRDATHDEVIGVWKAAQDTLAGWEEARRER